MFWANFDKFEACFGKFVITEFHLQFQSAF